MRYHAKVRIQAPSERVWGLLTDVANYPTWNPTVTKVEGKVALGSKVTVHTPLSKRAFPVKVAVLETNRKMVWQGGMPLGLFKGVRTYTLAPAGGGVDFEMEEVFSGPLLGLIKKSMPDLQPAFDEFARSLKAAAEK